MKFTTNTEGLQRNLQLIKQLKDSNENNLTLETIKDGKEIKIAYKYFNGVTTVIQIDSYINSIEDGFINTSFNNFNDLFNLVENDEVEIITTNNKLQINEEVNGVVNNISMKANKDKELKNTFDTSNKEFLLSMNIDDLLEVIKKQIKMLAKDGSIEVLNGINFNVKDKQLKIASIDGFRLSQSIWSSFGYNGDTNFTIHGKSIKVIERILKRVKKVCKEMDYNTPYLSFYKCNDSILIDIYGLEIMVHDIKGDFIEYERLLENNPLTKVTINTKKLLSGLKKALKTVNNNNNSLVVFWIDGNNFLITSKTDNKEIKTTIKDVEIKGGGLEIGFNCKYLIEALENVTSENVKLEFGKRVDPLKVNDNNFTYLVLPVRLSQSYN